MFRVIAVALVACGWIALVPSGAAAAPIAYYESFSGDLVSNQAPLTTFAFGAGVNTIDGMLGSSDFDAFAFVVPAGHQLAAGRVRLFNGPGGGSTITGVDWTFNAGSASPSGGSFIQFIHGVPDGADAVFPASPAGTYNLSAYGMSGSGGSNGSAVYRFTFDVQPVPEPAGLVLLGAGAMALLGRRRQRSDAARAA